MSNNNNNAFYLSLNLHFKKYQSDCRMNKPINVKQQQTNT